MRGAEFGKIEHSELGLDLQQNNGQKVRVCKLNSV